MAIMVPNNSSDDPLASYMANGAQQQQQARQNQGRDGFRSSGMQQHYGMNQSGDNRSAGQGASSQYQPSHSDQVQALWDLQQSLSQLQAPATSTNFPTQLQQQDIANNNNMSASQELLLHYQQMLAGNDTGDSQPWYGNSAGGNNPNRLFLDAKVEPLNKQRAITLDEDIFKWYDMDDEDGGGDATSASDLFASFSANISAPATTQPKASSSKNVSLLPGQGMQSDSHQSKQQQESHHPIHMQALGNVAQQPGQQSEMQFQRQEQAQMSNFQMLSQAQQSMFSQQQQQQQQSQSMMDPNMLQNQLYLQQALLAAQQQQQQQHNSTQLQQTFQQQGLGGQSMHMIQSNTLKLQHQGMQQQMSAAESDFDDNFVLPSTSIPPSVLASVYSPKKGALPVKAGRSFSKTSSRETNVKRPPPHRKPQEVLEDLLRARGHRFIRIEADDSGYEALPSPLQLASFGTKLVKAIHTCDIQSLSKLLECGLSPNPCNQFRDSVVDLVCKRANEDVFQCLLDHGCDLQVVDGFGRTPLHHAAWASTFSRFNVEKILEVDPVQLFMEDRHGQTPLEYVRSQLRWEWIDFLEEVADIYWPMGKPPPTLRSPKERRPDGTLEDPPGALPVRLASCLSSGTIRPEKVMAMSEEEKKRFDGE